MQGLSSRAHAFSVEALVGKPCKRMKAEDGDSLAAHPHPNTSDSSGETVICGDFWGEHLTAFNGETKINGTTRQKETSTRAALVFVLFH